MVGPDMARLAHNVFFLNTGSAGAVSRAHFSGRLLTPGTLAFLKSAR